MILSLLLFPLVHGAVLKHASRAKCVDGAEVAKQAYDYVVVGGGTAGLTVADRLTEDGKSTVLVIEIGDFYNATGSPSSECTFNIPSVPQTNLGNRRTTANVGNCVGGSSAINGMALMRATARDYDIWGELGGKDSTWTWKGVLPYFKKAIHLKEPNATFAAEFTVTYDTEVWGRSPSSRVLASFSSTFPELYKVAYKALQKISDLAFPRDGAAGSHGVYYYPISKDPATETRSYARTGHWDGLDRPNYHIITNQRVSKVNFRGKRAVSARFVPASGPGAAVTVRANREVILSAGALRTPQILQLSGIGPRKLLEEAGIDVKLDLPGVGANFQDHPIGPMVLFNWTPPNITTAPTPAPTQYRVQGLVAILSLPLLAPTTFQSIASTYANQDIATYLPPHTHPTILHGQRRIQSLFAREMLRPDGVSFLNYIVGGAPAGSPIGFHITSRGTVNINATDPEGLPVLDYRALSNPVDVDLMVAYIRWMRWHFSTNFAEYNVTEVLPGPGVDTDEALGRYVREGYSPQGWHPVGTAAKMPVEYGGVVDEELIVHGTENLRVVDASVMPALVAAATQQTVYMIGEKAADIIKAARKD